MKIVLNQTELAHKGIKNGPKMDRFCSYESYEYEYDMNHGSRNVLKGSKIVLGFY